MKTEYDKQAMDFLKKTGVKITKKYLDYKPYFQDDKESRDVYRITVSRGKNRFSYTFGQSITNVGKEPTDYDILSCMSGDSYISDSFEDFCENFGYDIDSRKAEKIYKAYDKNAQNINAFFSESELEMLREIQ